MKMAVMAVAMMALTAAGCANEAADPQESTQVQLSTDCGTVGEQWIATGMDCHESSVPRCPGIGTVLTCCGGANDGTSQFAFCGAGDDGEGTCGSWYNS